jgi:hypothetical protein
MAFIFREARRPKVIDLFSLSVLTGFPDALESQISTGPATVDPI